MNRGNIEKSASYDLIAEYLGIPKNTVKSYFNHAGYNRSISNPQDIARYIDYHLYNRGGVYIITNTINGMVYVGQSDSIYWRRDGHKYTLKNGNNGSKSLQEAYNKFGEDAFIYSVICLEDNKEKRLEIEKETMKKYGYANIYNCQGCLDLYGIYTKREIYKLTHNIDEIKEFLRTVKVE